MPLPAVQTWCFLFLRLLYFLKLFCKPCFYWSLIYQYFEGLINPINNMNFKPRRSGLSWSGPDGGGEPLPHRQRHGIAELHFRWQHVVSQQRRFLRWKMLGGTTDEGDLIVVVEEIVVFTSKPTYLPFTLCLCVYIIYLHYRHIYGIGISTVYIHVFMEHEPSFIVGLPSCMTTNVSMGSMI